MCDDATSGRAWRTRGASVLVVGLGLDEHLVTGGRGRELGRVGAGRGRAVEAAARSARARGEAVLARRLVGVRAGRAATDGRGGGLLLLAVDVSAIE